MASIRRSGDGWEVRWYVSGRRKSKKLYGTQREIELKAMALEAADKGRPHTAGPVTMAHVMTMWMVNGGRRRSPLTGAAVASRTTNWTIPRLGHLPVDKVTRHTLEDFYTDLSEHLSYGSIQNIRWDVSGALRQAVLDGHIDSNPADRARVRVPKPEGEVVPPLPQEIVDFLAALDTKGTKVAADVAMACRIATATGARAGEVCALRWEDFAPDPPALKIVRNAISHGGKVELRATKTRVRRRMGISDVLADRLEERHVQWPDTLFVLHGNDTDVPLNPHTLSSRFRQERDELGATFRFHDLRHFAASAFIADFGPHAASRAIGHTRFATTTDIYGHMIDPDLDARMSAAITRRIDL